MLQKHRDKQVFYVLLAMVVTFDTIHFETSLLNWFAAKNTEFIQRQKTQKKQIKIQEETVRQFEKMLALYFI